ncbi:MAG: beta-lactamase family protein [Armatimonadetes bacterium]|nr:beta-lactamase family protein [Armatimonadota bacterium]
MTLASLVLPLSVLQKDAIDQYVESEMARQHIPGLALLIVKDGKTFKEQAYGVSNDEKKTPTQVTDRFDIGSIGKTYTAALIMQLVEQTKIKLNQKVKDILPDFPDKWKDITVHQLISHQSGLPDYALVPGVGLMDTYDQQTWKDTMYKLDLDFPSGRMYQYSNTNFVILGLILEKIIGKPYREIATEQVFKRLGLTDTGFKEAGKPLPERSATGYFFIENKLQDAGTGGVSPTPSDGGEFSTVDDLRKWTEEFEAGKVVKKSTVRFMQTASLVTSGRKTGYGAGWMTNSIEGSPQITHGGNSVGFSGTISTFPKQRIEIYMLCNLYPVGGDGFAAGIARIMDPSLIRKPQVSTTDPNPKETEELMAGLIDLGKGDIKSPRFHEDMQLRLATGRGRMVLPTFANCVNTKKMEFISSHPEKPDTVLRYRVYDDKTTWIVDFQVTEDGKIYSIARTADLDKK